MFFWALGAHFFGALTLRDLASQHPHHHHYHPSSPSYSSCLFCPFCPSSCLSDYLCCLYRCLHPRRHRRFRDWSRATEIPRWVLEEVATCYVWLKSPASPSPSSSFPYFPNPFVPIPLSHAASLPVQDAHSFLSRPLQKALSPHTSSSPYLSFSRSSCVISSQQFSSCSLSSN